MKPWILHVRLNLFMGIVVQSRSGMFFPGFLLHVPTSFNTIRYVKLPSVNAVILSASVKSHYTASPNLTELWIALGKIWQLIPVEHLQKIVRSMSRRVEAVIKAR
ncbi:hypothetical protein TNCV_709971 [Trichonephila clavipes]|nr:hypothetical protein TNCV_709971 [Trichonephila clavipes]